MKVIVGCDESGRGSLFGRIYAGACIVEDEEKFVMELPDEIKIRDSKRMSELQRRKSYKYITEHCKAFATAYIDNEQIDKIGIGKANKRVLHMALDKLNKYNFEEILVDGVVFDPYVKKGGELVESQCIPKGDDNILEISCASIIAKYERDEYINKLCEDNEELEKYGIKCNKGYGTYVHFTGISKYGLTKWHRRTFLKNHS